MPRTVVHLGQLRAGLVVEQRVVHPPRSNPPPRSSSGAPIPCITPSTETNVAYMSGPTCYLLPPGFVTDMRSRRCTVRVTDPKRTQNDGTNRPEAHATHERQASARSTVSCRTRESGTPTDFGEAQYRMLLRERGE